MLVEEEEKDEDDESLSLLPNLRIYGAIKVVMIVTTPTIGKIEEEIAPTSRPPLTTTRDNSPLAEDIPNPVLIAVIASYFDLTKIPVIIRNFEAKEVRMSIIAGTINEGIT